MNAPMANRLPILTVLLLLTALLLAAAAHGAPVAQLPAADTLAFEEPLESEFEDEGIEEDETECGVAQEEVAEDELSQDEADEICDEEADEALPPARPAAKRPHRGKAGHRAQRHKKACRRSKSAAAKRHCPHRPGRR